MATDFWGQSAALVAVTNIASSLDDQMIRKMVLPKTKLVFERNSGDLKLTLNVLACLAQVIDRLDKSAIIDEVLPLLWDVKLQDPEIIQEVVSKYIFFSSLSARLNPAGPGF